MKQFYSCQFILILMISLLLSSCSEEEKITPSAQIVKYEATDNYQAPAGALYNQVNPDFTSSISFTNTSGVTVADDFTVPAGTSWSIKQVNAFFMTYANNPLMNVLIYRDNAGQIGELVHSSVNIEAAVIYEFPGGFTKVKSYQLDIADVRLGTGTYWIAFKQVNPEPSYTHWYTNTLQGNTFKYAVEGGEWQAFFEPLSLSFALLGDKRVTIEEVIQTLDNFVSTGSVTGLGSGKSADSRLQSFTKILINAKALIDQGLVTEACAQLANAQKRTHTGVTSNDKFITGEGTAELYDMITDVREELGCN